MRSLLAFGTLAATLALGVACTVHQATAPTLTGPSQFATAVSITATPDSISQDGASQASIVVLAFDSNGKPLPGLVIRLDMQVGGVTQDFGTLSAKSIVTGNDGKALSVYTAPPSSPAPSTNSGTQVSIRATTTGTNFDAAQSQSVEIRLVPPGVILPPADTPTPKFSFSPTTAAANLPTLFDASASCAGSSACTSTAGITNFAWNFGDGSSGTGVSPSHTFTLNGTFNVTLTVTNTGGVRASTSLAILVGAGNPPTVDFVFSPSGPVVNQAINFDASQARAGSGHSIAGYAWNLGDGTSATGVTTTHAYASPGTFNVTLTVTDEAGQATTVTKGVSVASGSGGGSGSTTAVFSFSPLTPSALQPVFFNASASTAATGHTLTTFGWNFGDGTVISGSTASATHTFLVAGTFTVTLTVTDDIGQKGTVATPVPVLAAGSGSLTAGFTASPIAPVSGALVSFNANTSTPLDSIIQFDWDFGDGTIVNNGGMIINHTYNTPVNATFTIRLTVHDNTGRTAVTPQTLPVSFGADPTAAFTVSPNPVTLVGASVNVTFDASFSVAGAGAITNYQWNFGDGSVIASVNPVTHPYTAKGTYTITLTVTQTNGRTNSTSHTLLVQ